MDTLAQWTLLIALLCFVVSLGCAATSEPLLRNAAALLQGALVALAFLLLLLNQQPIQVVICLIPGAAGFYLLVLENTSWRLAQTKATPHHYMHY